MPPPPSHPNSSEADAVQRLAALFRAHDWQVEVESGKPSLKSDLIARKQKLRYAVELKSVGEGRPDRVIALLSQAILQARRHAEGLGLQPLAVVQVGQASASLLRKMQQFHRDYAPDVAVGLVSADGACQFIGPGLEALNAHAPLEGGNEKLAQPRKASDLFSDLNQWMLKVLLAPELPERLLNAPRGEYRSVSQLAEAAQVSAMSASRFVRRLQEDGFLEESGRAFRLVRRRELFRLWQSSALRNAPELRMAFLIPGSGIRQLQKVLPGLNACVGLFAAADLLKLEHVSGVAPYAYVRRLRPPFPGRWPGLVPVKRGEAPQLILKQAHAAESLFRGAVDVDGLKVSDVLQIWLDASAHPARGAEQAELIRQKVLSGVIEGGA